MTFGRLRGDGQLVVIYTGSKTIEEHTISSDSEQVFICRRLCIEAEGIGERIAAILAYYMNEDSILRAAEGYLLERISQHGLDTHTVLRHNCVVRERLIEVSHRRARDAEAFELST